MAYLLKSKKYNYQADKFDVSYKLFDTEEEMLRYQAETNVPAGITHFFVMKMADKEEAVALLCAIDDYKPFDLTVDFW